MWSRIESNKEWLFDGIGVLIVGTVVGAVGRYIYRRYTARSKPSGVPATTILATVKKSVEPQQYEVRPREFSVWLGQEIPHIDIWVYVINYLSKEVVFDSFQVAQFHFSGGPTLEKLEPIAEVRIPPKSSASVLCRRNLIDSEARAIARVERLGAVNATFSLLCRALRGRKVLNRDYSSLSINGWIRGIPSS